VRLWAYLLNGVVVIAVWAITEYSNSGGWPERISEDGQPGNWNPWIVYALIGTAAIVGLRMWLLYGGRPITDADVRAEAERLRHSA
jgi:hypothetical protein